MWKTFITGLIIVVVVSTTTYLLKPRYNTLPVQHVVTVQAGDTLHSLIYKHYDDIIDKSVTIDRVDLMDSTVVTMRENNITSYLQPGQRIKIYITYRAN